MSQEGASHLRKGALDEVEPRSVFGGVDILEAPRAVREEGQGFL